MNILTKILATKVGVAKNVVARSCEFGVEARGGVIIPGQKLVCRSHVFRQSRRQPEKSGRRIFVFDGLLADSVDT